MTTEPPIHGTEIRLVQDTSKRNSVPNEPAQTGASSPPSITSKDGVPTMPGHARDTVAFPISENHKRVLRNSGRDYRDPHVRFQPATPALDLALGKNAQLSRNDPRADLLLKAKEAARDGLERFLKIAGVAILSLGGSTFSVAQPPVGPFSPSDIDLLTIDEVPLPTARPPVVLTEAPEIDWHFVPNEIAEITALAPVTTHPLAFIART